MKKILLSLLLLCSISTYSQHEADKWHFGVLAGLDFSNGSPVPLYGGALNTNEGCATISDNTGNLLFYTDGVTVWNRAHQVMPNGTGLLGGISSTQSSICIPLPGSTTIYYLFTVAEIGGPDGFCYSIVDMSLQAGMGDVDTNFKNVPLLTPVTEKLTAMKRQNGDYWIAVHEWGTNAFGIWQLTAAGVQMNPVWSNTGSVHSTAIIQNTYGAMKFSPCGDKIAAAIGYQDVVEVFDFDELTAAVSNPITIPIGYHVYGIEYSRSGDFLYVSCYDPVGTLLQFDLRSGDSATILASKTILSDVPDIYGLQIGNDGRIYVCKSFSQWLGVINFPNVAGLACNYVDQGLDLDPQFMGVTASLGLPAFIQSAFRLEIDCSTTGVSENVSENEFVISPNPSNGNFEIMLPPLDGTLSIYDAFGKNVFERKYNSSERKIDFSTLTLGIAPGITSQKSTLVKIFL